MKLGRAAFIVLLLLQCAFLIAYGAVYNSLWAPIVQGVLFLPAVVVWISLVCTKAKLRWLFYVWVAYVIAIVANIGIIFGTIGDKLDSKSSLSPTALKGVLCITPPLLLLLLHNADDLDDDRSGSDERKDLVSKLSYRMAIDLFDVVDMIDIVLDEKEHGNTNCSCAYTTINGSDTTIANSSVTTISENVGMAMAFEMAIVLAMVAVACLSLLMSLWQLFENKLSRRGTKIHFRVTIFRNLTEIVFVNLSFLIIRLVVWAKYHRDASIFIAKNIISIFLSILEINSLCESHSTKFWDFCKSCFD